MEPNTFTTSCKDTKKSLDGFSRGRLWKQLSRDIQWCRVSSRTRVPAVPVLLQQIRGHPSQRLSIPPDNKIKKLTGEQKGYENLVLMTTCKFFLLYASLPSVHEVPDSKTKQPSSKSQRLRNPMQFLIEQSCPLSSF